MSNPYSSVTINNYNANPPTDDGAQTSVNQINWKKIKEKIGDPIKTAFDQLNTHVGAAFGKQIGSSSLIASNTDLTMQAGHQGQSITFTGSANNTFSLLDATTAGSPFAVCVKNKSTGSLAIVAATATPVQTVDGAASILLAPEDSGLLFCDGSNWDYFGSKAGQKAASGMKCLFFQTAAPLGWTKLTDIDDAGIKIVAGTATDGGSVSFSAMFSQIALSAANIPQLTGTTGDDSPDHSHGYQHGPNGGWQVGGAAGSSANTNDNTGGASTRHRHPFTIGNASPVPLDFRLKYVAAIRAQKI